MFPLWDRSCWGRRGLERLTEVAMAAPEEIEVTPEMLMAGTKEFWSFDPRFEDASDVIARIYRAMSEAANGLP